MQDEPQAPEVIAHEDRLLAALAYPFWPLSLPYLTLAPEKKRVRFVRYHGYHAFFLGMGFWVGGILVNTAAAFVGKYVVLLGLLLYPLVKLLGLAAALVTAYAAWNAWRGEYLTLPYVSDLARPFIDEPAQAPPGTEPAPPREGE